MVAEPSGILLVMLGSGFCTMLVLIAILSMDPLDTSKSKVCASEMNLGLYPRMGSVDYVELALYDLCMVSDKNYERGRCWSGAGHFQVMNERNTVVQVPMLDFQALASNYGRTGQMVEL